MTNILNSEDSNEPWLKPIIKRLEEGQMPYMSDGLFYSLWKYANAERLTGKHLISFEDITPLGVGAIRRVSAIHFLSKLQELKIELENVTFHTDIYKKYSRSEHAYLEEYAKKNPNDEASKSLQKLFQNNANSEDILTICTPLKGLLIPFGICETLLEFTEFSRSPSEKNIKPLKKMLNAYLRCFTRDKLFSQSSKNFYNFSRQKEIFLYQIKSEVQDYVSTFAFKQGKLTSIIKGKLASINEDNSYLFIHTLAAMEIEGFFEVESVLIIDMELPPEENTEDYKVKVRASEKLLDVYGKREKGKNVEMLERLQDEDTIKFIVLGLFRDDIFRGLDEKQGKEFYIDLLDEVLANDIEFDILLKKEARDESFDTEFPAIAKPYIDGITKTLGELENNGWLKLEGGVKLEVFEKGMVGKELYKDRIIPAGKLLTHVLKIRAKEIAWSKFIEYVAEKYEGETLDWDNLYSAAKQESFIFQKIDKKRNDLDRNDDIILPLIREDYTDNRIQILNTLKRLEKEDFISISGFKVYELDALFSKQINLALKAKISVTQKFREKIEKDSIETMEYLSRHERKPALVKTTEYGEVKPKTKFDSLNGTLRYGDIMHSFHRGKNGDEPRLVLFKKLWEEKRYVKNGVVKAQGNPFPPESLSIQLGITEEARDFARNAKAKDELFALTKGINRILRNKKFPASIERKNGIQLVITEK